MLAHIITLTTTTIAGVGVSFRPLQHPLSPLPPPPRPPVPRPASAAAGNGSAYFIFKAGRIDNLQWRYVNAPSRTRATTAFFPPAGENFQMEKTVGTQSRIKGSRRLGEAEGFVGARSLGKVHYGTHSPPSRVLARCGASRGAKPQAREDCFFATLHVLHPDASR